MILILLLIPDGHSLYIFAYNETVRNNQLFMINLKTEIQTVLVTYYNSLDIDAVDTSVLINNKIYAVMSNIAYQNQYRVETNLLDNTYEMRSIPFSDSISCLYSVI